ncbi:SET domain-containing protein-lysine N-methyltransferase [Candidatus Woesearchaeota archaeon]|nr:SET domain-containing protein-lysine N-methyltransferase [Candidatus Woesearchaeota archaeon]MBW3006413.1 SET domain-containing protein-lysine N-methyltransferase [Candidatus Woesearchaeota archaeon]
MIKQKSRIHGYGIFAERKIAKNEEFYKIPLDNILGHNAPKAAHIGDGLYVLDEKVLNWVNHSCEPNSAIDLGKTVLYALREIASGEEITVDYDKTEGEGDKIPCNCGSRLCRGYFTGLV